MTGLGQLDGAGAAHDQRQSDLSLERGNVLTDGRLRERQRVRCGGERSAGHDLGEDPESAHIEH